MLSHVDSFTIKEKCIVPPFVFNAGCVEIFASYCRHISRCGDESIEILVGNVESKSLRVKSVTWWSDQLKAT